MKAPVSVSWMSATWRTGSRLRMSPLRSKAFVHSACLYSIAGLQMAKIIPRIFRIMVVRDRRASAWLLPLLSPVLSSAAGKRMPGRDQGVRVVREPHAGPRRGVMRCADRSAAARPGTRSCAQPPLVDNPKLLLICPRIYLVLPLRPDVSRSNVLLLSSVILYVEMGTCAHGPGGHGGEFACGSNVAARGRFVRAWRAWGGTILLGARHARRVARPGQALVKIVRCHRSRMPRAPHRGRTGQTCSADGSAASNLVMHPRTRLVGGVSRLQGSLIASWRSTSGGGARRTGIGS